MIPLIKSTFYKETATKRALGSFIRSAKQLSFGPQCERFERQFAIWQGRHDCVMVNSGSSANLAIIQALLNLRRIKRGDMVAFSSVTWSTNVMPLLQLGLIPIPVDVELGTLNISSRTLASVIAKYPIRALFLTDLLGLCDDPDEIARLCADKRILLIEDTCESLGSVYRGTKLGNFGLAATMSFYVGHHMSTVEGGAIVTNDTELATMLRLVRAHGWDRNLSFADQHDIRMKYRVNSTFYSRYTFYDLGYNLRPTEITGFLGSRQLTYLDEIVAKRERNFRIFADRLYTADTPYYAIRSDHLDTISSFVIPVVCRDRHTRDELVRRCAGKVEIRPIVGGDMNRQPFFRTYSKSIKLPSCPNARIIHEQGLYFGNNPELTRKEMETILGIFAPAGKRK